MNCWCNCFYRLNDGWHSPSIGSRGACSHHGGVNNHGILKFLALCLSVGIGVFTFSIISKVNKIFQKTFSSKKGNVKNER